MSDTDGIPNENNYLNNYLINYLINTTRTFQTNDKIYGDFKKTCVQLDVNIGDKLTDFMKEFIIKHNSKVEILNSAGKEAQLSALPHLFESDVYWKQYFLDASHDTCKKVRIRLESLLSTVNYWESLSEYEESIDWDKEMNKKPETDKEPDKIQFKSESETNRKGWDEFFYK